MEMKDSVEIIHSAWTITPDAVYGFILTLMLVIIGLLALAVRYLYLRVEGFSSKLATVVHTNNNILEKLEKTIDEYNDPEKRNARQIYFMEQVEKMYDRYQRK